MTSSDKPSLFRPAVGNRGMTKLHYSAYCGDLPALERLLRAGADPNVKDQYRGYNALHWLTDMAATGGPRLQMLKLLVASGADVSATSDTGASALSLALAAGNTTGDQLAQEVRSLGCSE
jgi:ankyrin repeat protein